MPLLERVAKHLRHAAQIRCSIRNRECYCTNEIFMWPSIVFQPLQLARALWGSKAWVSPDPLPRTERVDPGLPVDARAADSRG